MCIDFHWFSLILEVEEEEGGRATTKTRGALAKLMHRVGGRRLEVGNT